VVFHFVSFILFHTRHSLIYFPVALFGSFFDPVIRFNMAPVWSWVGAFLAALPVALAGHGDPIAQKYIVEFADSKTVRLHIIAAMANRIVILTYLVLNQLPLHTECPRHSCQSQP
jgi:hypothetical protein